MPEEVLKREEWVYWHGRAHAVRGNHEDAKKLFASIAGNWSFYGKLACDALKRPYPKPTLREPPAEESVRRWEENAGIRRAEVFYRLHWYADGHREWNWALIGIEDSRTLRNCGIRRRSRSGASPHQHSRQHRPGCRLQPALPEAFCRQDQSGCRRSTAAAKSGLRPYSSRVALYQPGTQFRGRSRLDAGHAINGPLGRQADGT